MTTKDSYLIRIHNGYLRLQCVGRDEESGRLQWRVTHLRQNEHAQVTRDNPVHEIDGLKLPDR